jgi:hypothetical protein
MDNNANAPANRDFYMGVDLGQAQDYTAIIVLGVSTSNGQADEYHVGHCERLPLGTSYELVTQHIKELIAIWTQQNQNITLVVDSTGCGRPVIDSMRGDGLKPVPITVHGGQSVSCDESGWRVPKRDLVAAAKVLLGKKQLKIGRSLPFADVLITELQNFQVKVNIATGHDTYEAWREGAHDDLVFAVSLACWWALKHPKKKDEPTCVPTVMWKPSNAHISGTLHSSNKRGQF